MFSLHRLWFIPIPVIYTPFRPFGFDGYAFGPVILIHQDSRGDEGLHRHELEHIRQGFMTLGLHPLLYWLIRPYRLWAERKAYEAQGFTERQIFVALEGY